jgi:hypothetical protein
MPRVKRTPAEQRLADGAGPEFLEALARSLRIVQVFNSDRRQLTLSDIARPVDLPRALGAADIAYPRASRVCRNRRPAVPGSRRGS